jgi:hypothetical protein
MGFTQCCAVQSRRLKLLTEDDGLGFRAGVSDAAADPFCERFSHRFSMCRQILGGSFCFESTSEVLLNLVEAAYADLPSHQFPMIAPEFRIELRLLPRQASPHSGEPPPMQVQSGAGMLCGVMDASNYVVLAPEQHRALVVASEDMLSHPYHLRYELIEFAVFTLATRGLGLVGTGAASCCWEPAVRVNRHWPCTACCKVWIFSPRTPSSCSPRAC